MVTDEPLNGNTGRYVDKVVCWKEQKDILTLPKFWSIRMAFRRSRSISFHQMADGTKKGAESPAVRSWIT